jgi:hypothetical protein
MTLLLPTTAKSLMTISAAKTWETISVSKSDQSVLRANEPKVVHLEAVIAAETEAVEAVPVAVAAAVVAAVADSDVVVAEEAAAAVVVAAVVAEADPVAAVAAAVEIVAKPGARCLTNFQRPRWNSDAVLFVALFEEAVCSDIDGRNTESCPFQRPHPTGCSIDCAVCVEWRR